MVLSLVTLAAPVIAALAPQADPMLDRARRLLREVPIIDGHNDYPWEVRQKAAMDLNKLDMRRPQPTIMTNASTRFMRGRACASCGRTKSRQLQTIRASA